MGKKVQQKSSQKPKVLKPKSTELYAVEEIKDVAYVQSVPFYKVKWINYPEKDCTWEPASNLKNFQGAIAKIHRRKSHITNYDNLKMLYLNKPLQAPIIVKTEDYVKKVRPTGRSVAKKQIAKKRSQVVVVEEEKPIIRIQGAAPKKDKELNISKVIDLQQVYHQQTKRLHILSRVLRKPAKEGDQSGWVHLSDLRKSKDTLSLLVDFLLENVQFESKVMYADDNEGGKNEFKEVNFYQ